MLVAADSRQTVSAEALPLTPARAESTAIEMAPAQSKLARNSSVTLSTLLSTLSSSAKDKPVQTLALPLLIALLWLRRKVVKAAEEAKRSK